MTQPVIIRPAQKKDALGIWHLLHSDYKNVDIDLIASNSEDFYVLLHGMEILAVYDNSIRGIIQHETIVHPLYPQKLMTTAMTNIIDGVLKRSTPS